MDPEIAWQDLVAAALLGTERKPFTAPTVAPNEKELRKQDRMREM